MDRNGHVIFAVDFDGTLSFGRWPDIGEPNKALFQFLIREQQEKGSRIILYTCRNGAELDAAVEYCREQGLIFDTVNENLPELIELYGGDTRKINAEYYLDDKAVNPIAGHFTIVPAGFNFKEREGSNHEETESDKKERLSAGVPCDGTDHDGDVG